MQREKTQTSAVGTAWLKRERAAKDQTGEKGLGPLSSTDKLGYWVWLVWAKLEDMEQHKSSFVDPSQASQRSSTSRKKNWPSDCKMSEGTSLWAALFFYLRGLPLLQSSWRMNNCKEENLAWWATFSSVNGCKCTGFCDNVLTKNLGQAVFAEENYHSALLKETPQKLKSELEMWDRLLRRHPS